MINERWPVCPYCDITINDWHCLPASVVKDDTGYFKSANCPKCKKKYLVKMKTRIEFETEKAETDN
jgi:DNA-directed RNA polymerase subunit RPC12/RpoP